ncbi:hypothetical protein [Modestobacter lapidis]|nr:hypothetical protein [Modestobacter lapidis]
MSDERDTTTTGFVDRGAPAAGPDQAGATAVPDPRAEVRTAPQPTAPEPEPVDGQPPVPPAADQPAGAARPAGPAPSTEQPEADRPPTGAHPTVPVPVPVRVRPRPRVPNRDQMIRMGPWAPVAGAVLGLVLGVVVVLLLASAVSSFAERLSLVFVVLGMTLLGAGGTLLADEVRLLRRGTSAIEARSSGAEAIAGLLNGLTPARLLVLASAFVLLLSAYVTTRG